MSKPTVNLRHPQVSLFASVSGITGADQTHIFYFFISTLSPPLHCFFLCSSLSCRAPHHHIQSVAFQIANFLLVNCSASAKRCGVVKMFLWWSVVFFVDSCLNDAIQGSNLAEDWLVQSCPGLRIVALTACAKLWPDCAYSWLVFVLHTWMSSPQGVVLGSLLLAWDWMDIGEQPKPN